MPNIQFYHHPDYVNPNGHLGYERTPQQPLKGERVTLGAAVEGAAELALSISVDGSPLPGIMGHFVKEEHGKRFFEFEPGSFAYGSRVEYRFEAAGQASRAYGFDVARETPIETFQGVYPEEGGICIDTGNAFIGNLYLSFTESGLVLSPDRRAGRGVFRREAESVAYQDSGSASYVEINLIQASLNVYGPDGRPALKGLRLSILHTANSLTGFTFSYETSSAAVYGLGERFDSVNHIGQSQVCAVTDNYTNQRKSTYFPLPFYHCDDGHGVFVDTPCVSEYDFGSAAPGRFSFGARIGAAQRLPDIHIWFGEPKGMLQRFAALAGKPSLPPMWAFGLWVSANRWNRQRHIEEQLGEIEAAGYPADVAVIEAWSDEATFYIWNEAQYGRKQGSECLSADDFHYPEGGRWPDPQGMIGRLHGMGMKLVLWQIPVLKRLGSHEPANEQHDQDIRYAIENGYCARDGEGGAYSVPNFWFAGSKLPDFTKARMRDWWFSKRKYLLDMGVDGFKTDGGEFVYEDGCSFANGSTGVEMKNGFVSAYLDAYAGFAGPERILFSRAGYTGAHRRPMHWAGDQESTWREFRSVLRAGLSVGMSGVPFWSFDIAGFAGSLPTAELYIRSTELAAFAPAMQWHSDFMHSQPDFDRYPVTGLNDRSPWNVARATGDSSVMKYALYYAWLHANLLPQLYSEAQKSAASGLPMMRHLALDYPGDPNVRGIADEFMLGGLLAAPVMEEGARGREVYLPKGFWMDVWTGEDIEGGRTVRADAPLGVIPLYLRHGGALALHLGPDKIPGRPFDKTNPELCFLTAGKTGKIEFHDMEKSQLTISWSNDKIDCDGTSVKEIIPLSKTCFKQINIL